MCEGIAIQNPDVRVSRSSSNLNRKWLRDDRADLLLLEAVEEGDQILRRPGRPELSPCPRGPSSSRVGREPDTALVETIRPDLVYASWSSLWMCFMGAPLKRAFCDFASTLLASLVCVGCQNQCAVDEDCGDANPCTLDWCTEARCETSFLADGTPCQISNRSGICRAGDCIEGGAGGAGGGGGIGGHGGSGGSALGCGEPPSAAVVIEDQDFDDANWTLAVAQTEGATVSTAPTGQLSAGGVAGSGYRSMAHEITNPSVGEDPKCTADSCSFSLSVTHQYQLGSYTPAADGAIEHIDYSEARIITEPAFEGAAVGWTFAIWQDGNRYVLSPASRPSTAFRDVSWATESSCRLTPESFTPEGLNFVDGSAMTFGYVRSNTNTSAGTTQRNVHGIDDFRVVIVKTN